MATLVTSAFGCIGAWKTLDEFAALQKAGRLDARELEPGT